MKLLLFASARENVGQKMVNIDLTRDKELSGNEIMNKILKIYPSLSEISKESCLAVNEKYLMKDDKVVLREGDILAFIPPVSGG